jgi:hypothetical protein
MSSAWSRNPRVLLALLWFCAGAWWFDLGRNFARSHQLHGVDVVYAINAVLWSGAAVRDTLRLRRHRWASPRPSRVIRLDPHAPPRG